MQSCIWEVQAELERQRQLEIWAATPEGQLEKAVAERVAQEKAILQASYDQDLAKLRAEVAELKSKKK
jgi:hypothetical protein